MDWWPWLLLFFVIIVASGVFILVTGVDRVPPGHFGVVYRRFGRWHEGDRNFGEVRAHGSPGTQAQTLKPDRLYVRPRLLFHVTTVPRIKVPPGTIGVVVAKDGAPPPLTRTLSKHVECDNFQDGQAFLRNRGQRGRQPGVLPGDASYAINPELFEVITADTIGAGRADLTAAALKEIRIPEGTTGVVVVYGGEKHNKVRGAVGRRVPGHESFQLPSVFLDNQGQQGVQQETLNSGGVYRINPWFAQVELVPTRVLVLEWNNEKKSSGSFDATLDQIRINVEGHWLRFDLSQTISIPPEAAPRLVSEFGQQEPARPDSNPVRRFVDRVLGPLVQGYFQTSFGEYKILSFVSRADTVCRELETKVRQVLENWNIEVVRTELSNFAPEGVTLDEFRRRRAEIRDRKQELEHIQENTEIEERIKRRQLETAREERKLDPAILRLEAEIELLGRDNVAMRSFLAELAKMKVPEVVAGNAESLLSYMSLPMAQDLITKAFGRTNTAIDATPAQQLNATPATDRDGQPESEAHDDPEEERRDGRFTIV